MLDIHMNTTIMYMDPLCTVCHWYKILQSKSVHAQWYQSYAYHTEKQWAWRLMTYGGLTKFVFKNVLALQISIQKYQKG